MTMPVDPIEASVKEATPVPPEPAVEPIALRLATADDAAALALVSAATFLEAYTWMLPGADILAHCTKNLTAESYAKYLALPTTRIVLATAGLGAPVGYVMLSKPDLPDIEIAENDTELKRIYLFSRFRSSKTPVVGHPGVRTGQALMDAAVEQARAMGCGRVLLGTNDGNERAIAFYQRNGFKVVGTRTFQVGSKTCSDLIFAKELGAE